MITKLLESQSFSKVWKAAVRQTFCSVAKYDFVTLSADRLGNTSFSLIWKISLQTLRKIYVGYLEIRLKTCDNVKLVIAWNVSFHFASCSFKNTSKQLYDFQLIEASVWEVIKSWKLQRLGGSYKHEAFQKVKHKLDLTEQPYLDKIHSR